MKIRFNPSFKQDLLRIDNNIKITGYTLEESLSMIGNSLFTIPTNDINDNIESILDSTTGNLVLSIDFSDIEKDLKTYVGIKVYYRLDGEQDEIDSNGNSTKTNDETRVAFVILNTDSNLNILKLDVCGKRNIFNVPLSKDNKANIISSVISDDTNYLESIGYDSKNLFTLEDTDDLQYTLVTKDSYYRYLRKREAEVCPDGCAWIDEKGRNWYENTTIREYVPGTFKAYLSDTVPGVNNILSKRNLFERDPKSKKYYDEGSTDIIGTVNVYGYIDYIDYKFVKGIYTEVEKGTVEISGIDGVEIVNTKIENNFRYNIDNKLYNIDYYAKDSTNNNIPAGNYKLVLSYYDHISNGTKTIESNEFRLVQARNEVGFSVYTDDTSYVYKEGGDYVFIFSPIANETIHNFTIQIDELFDEDTLLEFKNNRIEVTYDTTYNKEDYMKSLFNIDTSNISVILDSVYINVKLNALQDNTTDNWRPVDDNGNSLERKSRIRIKAKDTYYFCYFYLIQKAKEVKLVPYENTEPQTELVYHTTDDVNELSKIICFFNEKSETELGEKRFWSLFNIDSRNEIFEYPNHITPVTYGQINDINEDIIHDFWPESYNPVNIDITAQSSTVIPLVFDNLVLARISSDQIGLSLDFNDWKVVASTSLTSIPIRKEGVTPVTKFKENEIDVTVINTYKFTVNTNYSFSYKWVPSNSKYTDYINFYGEEVMNQNINGVQGSVYISSDGQYDKTVDIPLYFNLLEVTNEDELPVDSSGYTGVIGYILITNLYDNSSNKIPVRVLHYELDNDVMSDYIKGTHRGQGEDDIAVLSDDIFKEIVFEDSNIRPDYEYQKNVANNYSRQEFKNYSNLHGAFPLAASVMGIQNNERECFIHNNFLFIKPDSIGTIYFKVKKSVTTTIIKADSLTNSNYRETEDGEIKTIEGLFEYNSDNKLEIVNEKAIPVFGIDDSGERKYLYHTFKIKNKDLEEKIYYPVPVEFCIIFDQYGETYMEKDDDGNYETTYERNNLVDFIGNIPSSIALDLDYNIDRIKNYYNKSHIKPYYYICKKGIDLSMKAYYNTTDVNDVRIINTTAENNRLFISENIGYGQVSGDDPSIKYLFSLYCNYAGGIYMNRYRWDHIISKFSRYKEDTEDLKDLVIPADRYFLLDSTNYDLYLGNNEIDRSMYPSDFDFSRLKDDVSIKRFYNIDMKIDNPYSILKKDYKLNNETWYRIGYYITLYPDTKIIDSVEDKDYPIAEIKPTIKLNKLSLIGTCNDESYYDYSRNISYSLNAVNQYTGLLNDIRIDTSHDLEISKLEGNYCNINRDNVSDDLSSYGEKVSIIEGYRNLQLIYNKYKTYTSPSKSLLLINDSLLQEPIYIYYKSINHPIINTDSDGYIDSTAPFSGGEVDSNYSAQSTTDGGYFDPTKSTIVQNGTATVPYNIYNVTSQITITMEDRTFSGIYDLDDSSYIDDSFINPLIGIVPLRFKYNASYSYDYDEDIDFTLRCTQEGKTYGIIFSSNNKKYIQNKIIYGNDTDINNIVIDVDANETSYSFLCGDYKIVDDEGNKKYISDGDELEPVSVIDYLNTSDETEITNNHATYKKSAFSPNVNIKFPENIDINNTKTYKFLIKDTHDNEILLTINQKKRDKKFEIIENLSTYFLSDGSPINNSHRIKFKTNIPQENLSLNVDNEDVLDVSSIVFDGPNEDPSDKSSSIYTLIIPKINQNKSHKVINTELIITDNLTNTSVGKVSINQGYICFLLNGYEDGSTVSLSTNIVKKCISEIKLYRKEYKYNEETEKYTIDNKDESLDLIETSSTGNKTFVRTDNNNDNRIKFYYSNNSGVITIGVVQESDTEYITGKDMISISINSSTSISVSINLLNEEKEGYEYYVNSIIYKFNITIN